MKRRAPLSHDRVHHVGGDRKTEGEEGEEGEEGGRKKKKRPHDPFPYY